MSDQSPQDKPHKATPRRHEEARRKGQVPRSVEVNAAVLLLVGAGVVAVGSGPLVRGVLEIYGAALAQATAPPQGAPAMAAWLGQVGWTLLGAMAPVILTIAGVALLVAGGQGRGVIAIEPLKPKWEKIDPVKNAKKLWGWKALMELGKSVLKLAIIGTAIAVVFLRVQDRIPVLVHLSPVFLLQIIRESAFLMLLLAGGAYLLVAAADYSFQVWQHERSLRMSHEELKRERKESDGDPHVRARRLSMGRSLARRRMILAVSEADVVLTNPTHVAVALKWDPAVAPAPIVLAMGTRKLALRIRQRAREAGVLVVEHAPLTRALYRAGKVGHPIPVEFYVLVAEVLAFVFRERARRNPAWQGAGTA